MQVDTDKLIHMLVKEHTAFISDALNKSNSFSNAVPNSVHKYTEMFLDKVVLIIQEANKCK